MKFSLKNFLVKCFIDVLKEKCFIDVLKEKCLGFQCRKLKLVFDSTGHTVNFEQIYIVHITLYTLKNSWRNKEGRNTVHDKACSNSVIYRYLLYRQNYTNYISSVF